MRPSFVPFDSPLVALFVAAVGGLACVSASHAEPQGAPEGQLELAEAPAPEPAPAPALEPAPEPAPAPAPAPELADSEIRTGAVLEPGIAAGLVEFAAELFAEAPGEAETEAKAGVEPGGSLWVGKLEGNGGREVLIYIPPGADDAAPFELVFHFHGTYSETVQARRPEMKKKREWIGWERLEQTMAAIAELQAARSHNLALVYPLSAGKRLEPGHRGWSNVAYDRMWMDPAAAPDYRDDFARLYDESVAILRAQLGVHPSKLPDAVIAEGHSAGGIALLNIARNGSAHVREYIFLDASFQSWADGCWAAVEESGAPARLTLVVTDKGMTDPFEGRDPWCVDWAEAAALWAQKKSWCASRPNPDEEEIAEIELSCAELEERAQEWREDYRDWCAAMKEGMEQLDGVTLIETKVFHKNMPRAFSGGLGLPEDR